LHDTALQLILWLFCNGRVLPGEVAWPGLLREGGHGQ
jgi:hypothetical protein